MYGKIKKNCYFTFILCSAVTIIRAYVSRYRVDLSLRLPRACGFLNLMFQSLRTKTMSCTKDFLGNMLWYLQYTLLYRAEWSSPCFCVARVCVSDLDVPIVEHGDDVPHEGVVWEQPVVSAVYVGLQVLLGAVHVTDQLQDELVFLGPLVLLSLLMVSSLRRRVVGVRQERARDTPGEKSICFLSHRK